MPRLGQVFSARDRIPVALFEDFGRTIGQSTELLYLLVCDCPDHRERADELRELEHEADRTVADIYQHINQAVGGPAEREDVLHLASALDDIVDYTEEVADYLGLYRIEAPTDHSISLARVLRDAAGHIAAALSRLRGFQSVADHTGAIRVLETEGDRLTREAVAALFDGGIDPMVVIRWKDLYERLESAIDASERAANILEGIIIKHG